MPLTLESPQPDCEDEVVPEPKEEQLREGWRHKWVKVDTVPKVVVMVDQHLNTLQQKEFSIFAVSECLNEL